MVNAVLMALMLLPLLGTVPWQTGQPDPSTQHEREVAVSPHLGGVSEQLAGNPSSLHSGPRLASSRRSAHAGHEPVGPKCKGRDEPTQLRESPAQP